MCCYYASWFHHLKVATDELGVQLTGPSALPPLVELAHLTPSSCCCRCRLTFDVVLTLGARLIIFTARAAACGPATAVPTRLVWICLVNILACVAVALKARVEHCMHAHMQAYV